jgi:hypothetical protein
MARRFHPRTNVLTANTGRNRVSSQWERTSLLVTFMIALTALILHWSPQPSVTPGLTSLNQPTGTTQHRVLISQSGGAVADSKLTSSNTQPIVSAQAQSLTENARQRVPQTPIRLQILNGCGIKGLGRTLSPALRSKGFDVREVRNARNFKYVACVVIDRVGKMEQALAVADSLGLDHSQVTTEFDDRLVDIDVSLIVGSDLDVSRLNQATSKQE